MGNFKKINKFSSLLLGLTPILGYLAAYFYQFGKYNFFQIDQSLIQVTVETTIFASIIILVIISYLFICVHFLYTTVPSTVYETIKLLLIFASIISILTFILLSPIDWIYRIILIIIINVFLFSPFLLPLSLKEPKDYKLKFERYWQLANERYGLLQAEYLMNMLNENKKNLASPVVTPQYILLMIFFMFIAWIVFSFALGRAVAINNTSYYTYTINEQMYIYMGNFMGSYIMLDADVDKKETGSNLILIPSSQEIHLEIKNIGKLNEIDKGV